MTLSRRRLLGLSALALGACGGRALAGLRDAGEAIGPAGLFAPRRGDLRLLLISDLNGAYGSTSYLPEVHRGVKLIPDWQPDLVLCGGDMIAAQKLGLGQERLHAMWLAFERQVLAPIRTAGLPFAPTPGNHDASGSRFGGAFMFAEDRQAARRFWQARRQQLGLNLIDGHDFPFYYALRQGELFLITWDASSATVPAEQVVWAERNLASAAASSARFRVVMGHLPLFGVSQGRDRRGERLEQASALRALMERHGVLAYISGHQHAWFPGKVGSIELLQLGALGAGPRRLLGDSRPAVQTLTVWDLFQASGDGIATTYNMQTLQPILSRTLPAMLEGEAGRVPRLDPFHY